MAVLVLGCKYYPSKASPNTYSFCTQQGGTCGVWELETFDCDAGHQTDSVQVLQYPEIPHTAGVPKGWVVVGVHRQCLLASVALLHVNGQHKMDVAELCCTHSYASEIPAEDWEPALDTVLPMGSQSDTQSTGSSSSAHDTWDWQDAGTVSKKS